MAIFGLICEGITDQIVIENILHGYFNHDDVEVTELQPLRDATNDNLAATAGNWHRVFEYCGSEAFIAAFSQPDLYAIIQVDTDIFHRGEVGEKYQISTKKEDGSELPPPNIVANIVAKFVEVIGEENYQRFKDRIIFAIAVQSIECWLLPLYYTDNRQQKTVNCLTTLNTALSSKEGFSIHKKEIAYYRKIARPYLKNRIIKQKYSQNASLTIFIENVAAKNIEFAEKEDW